MESTDSNIGHKLANDKVLDFLFGGSALFTIRNSETGNHMSFKVTKSKKKDCYFVIKNDGKIFLGTIFDKNKFVLGKNNQSLMDSPEVKAFTFVFYNLLKKTLPSKVEIWHSGKCCRCGRTLVDPLSCELGIGPECRRKMSENIKTAAIGNRRMNNEYDRIFRQ